MGAPGLYELILPKNSGKKSFVDKSIDILYQSESGILPSSELHSKMSLFLKEKDVGRDTTSVIHKAVQARYFGLVELTDDRNYVLSDYGLRYANSKSDVDRVELILEIISEISFGRENNAVKKSNSAVDPPVAFIKMLYDLNTASLLQFGCLLYELESNDAKYINIIKKLKNSTEEDLKIWKKSIEEKGGRKFFDPKFHILLRELKVIERMEKNYYKLSSLVSNEFRNRISHFLVRNSSDKIKEIPKLKHESDVFNKNFCAFMESFDKKTNHSNSCLSLRNLKNRSQTSAKTNRFQGRFRNEKSSKFSNKQKFQIGWRGEEYIFSLLGEKNIILLNNLRFKEDEAILKINWFNYGFKQNECGWLDKSMGHGFDIEVETNERKIFLEIKTSWENTNLSTITRNELKTMKDLGLNYYLVKINNFKNAIYDNRSVSLLIEKNPFNLVLNANYIKEVTLFI